MLFSSISFLYYFLPLVLLFYFLAPKKLKNSVLLTFSLIFYGWGEPKYVFLMAATIIVGYIMGLLTEKYREKSISKLFVGIAVIFPLALLGYFKYADFFISNFAKATGLSIPLLGVVLPIGISFYSFQILSYNIDVYKKEVKAQKNIINLGAYITFFPQLIAGPIVRYSNIEHQLTARTHTFDKTALGIKRFIIGFSKKVLLANTLGEFCKVYTSGDEKSLIFTWVYVIAYMLQIYFDFSGYSDMAIGLGKIFGFDFLENFNYPFISKSITEFWRRWHMSLGTWFRDYVYIPMGGNRVNMPRLFLNIFTVWFLTGFWHGAEWNFIIWGIYFAVFLLIEKFFLINYLKKSKVISRIYTLFLVAVSFAIFSANNLAETGTIVGNLFGLNALPVVTDGFLYAIRNYGVVILIGIIASTPIPKALLGKCLNNKGFKKFFDVIELPLMVLLLVVATGYLADGSFNPFLYFRF